MAFLIRKTLKEERGLSSDAEATIMNLGLFVDMCIGSVLFRSIGDKLGFFLFLFFGSGSASTSSPLNRLPEGARGQKAMEEIHLSLLVFFCFFSLMGGRKRWKKSGKIE